jgi:hypothetical protein
MTVRGRDCDALPSSFAAAIRSVMQIGNPDPEPTASAPSLAQRLAALARARVDDARSPRDAARWPKGSVAALVAALIAAGPLLTIGGAKLLAGQQRSAAAALESDASPRIEAARAAEAARNQMAAVLRRPALGATIEALARALPSDATLLRAERNPAGALELEIATPDPDRLRAALRRAPAFARLRNTGQRRADAKMIVLFAETAP